jgi:uncharacterized phosphosugar-binding protein
MVVVPSREQDYMIRLSKFSGGNIVPVGMALGTTEKGLIMIAVTNLTHIYIIKKKNIHLKGWIFFFLTTISFKYSFKFSYYG